LPAGELAFVTTGRPDARWLRASIQNASHLGQAYGLASVTNEPFPADRQLPWHGCGLFGVEPIERHHTSVQLADDPIQAQVPPV